MKHTELLLSISLLLLSNIVSAQDTTSFTLREVYYFTVGDVFHIKIYNPSIGFIKRQVTVRIEVNSDSIVYTYLDSVFKPNSYSERIEFDKEEQWSEGFGNLDSVISQGQITAQDYAQNSMISLC